MLYTYTFLSRTSHGYINLLLGHSYYTEVTQNVTISYDAGLLFRKKCKACIGLAAVVLGRFSV